jgi:DHA1 family multidrug resistance protein-like MFS transporter
MEASASYMKYMFWCLTDIVTRMGGSLTYLFSFYLYPLMRTNEGYSFKKKLFTSAILAFQTFVSVFGSSIFSAGIPYVAAQFHVGREVGTLGTSLYVLGFAFGPILWAPLSELKGRRLPLVIASFGLIVFNFAVATGKDLQTIFISRFFAGFFGSAPLSVVAAVFSDIFDNKSRGLAVTVFSLCVFTGPLMAPFVGGFISMNPHLGWRWTEYIVGILCSLAFVLVLFFMNETYPPVVLIQKAEELRRRTKNWGIHAKQEEIEVDFRELIERNFSRPLRMLTTEPIVLLLSLYMAFIYGLLYLFLTAYPLVFQGVYHFNGGVGGLPFFGMITGELLAGVLMILRQPAYVRKLVANNNRPIPEWRLPEIIIGGVAFAGGLFWLGWSGYTGKVHWIVPTLSGLLSGFGLMCIFLQALNYLVDAYLMVSSSYSCLLLYTNHAFSLLLLPLPRILCCVHYLEQFSRFLEHTCSKAWAFNGHVHFLGLLDYFWCPSQSGSYSKEQRLGRRVLLLQPSHLQQPNRKRKRYR